MSVTTTEPLARYRLLAKWASGGMADVYVARQHGAAGFDKIVALKFLRECGDDTGFREMFLEEVRTAALLNHPSIVQTFDTGEVGDRLFMAMEFVNGEMLGRFARVVAHTNGSFPPELAVAIARDLANALEYAHTLTNLDGVPMQLVHRDVSPSNVLLSFDGMVKLLDFGIAKVATTVHATKAGVLKGKLSYMSPEQARGDEIDRRSDIYSLGIVLWKLLTGREPFEARSDLELMRAVVKPRLPPPSQAGARSSVALDAIVMQALAPEVDARYESAGEFATALSRYLTRTAAGFDSTKLIRGLMGAHFSERRERLARLVRQSETDLPLVDIDQLRSSIQTSAPASSAPPRATTLATVGTGMPVERDVAARRHRWPVLALVTMAATAGGYVAYERGASSSEPAAAPARDAEPSSPIVKLAQRSVNEPKPEPAAAQLAASPDARSRTERSDAPAPASDATPRAVVATTVRPAVSSPPRAVALKRRAASLGTAPKPVVKHGAGSGSAKVETPRAVVAIEPAPPVERPSAAPVDAGVPVVPPVLDIGSLDAMPIVSKVAVDGSLPTSEIHSVLDRTRGALRECYRAAAKRASKTPAFAIRISFEIDEARATRSVRIAGDVLGVAPCVRDAVSTIRTRSAPDVGTVTVIALVTFRPVKP